MSKLEKLSNSQKKFLKGIAHGLNPVIMIGANGLTENLMLELEGALEHHELLKIKIASADRAHRKTLTQTILETTGAFLIQDIGKTIVIFRQSDESELELPK